MPEELFTFSTTSRECRCDSSVFPLAKPDARLFDETARRLARDLAKPQVLKEEGRGRDRRWVVKDNDKANRPTQVRKFYDELRMWEQKSTNAEVFQKFLPYIKMMNAKVAYAKGREFVDDKFEAWFASCLGQIRQEDESSLLVFKNFCTLFEAFLGFYKVERPKD
ncbi:MAG: type III-A CRISPR-associated protein Csm2 [Acidobacteriota bacterium]